MDKTSKAVLWIFGILAPVVAIFTNLYSNSIDTVFTSYLFFSANSACALVTVSLLVAHDIKLGTAFSLLCLQAFCLVFTTSAIYNGFGFITPEDYKASNYDSLYFSIVTWTTLGYGDFQPKPELRLLAGFQALFGYMFLGLIVGSVSSFLGETKPKP